MKKSTLANLLTFAGVIPFIALLLAMIIPDLSFLFRMNTQYYFLTYSAIILTFLGGMQWGIALTTEDAFATTLLISSNIIALAAWASLILVPPQIGLVIHFLFFASILFIDRKLFSLHLVPGWFMKLRYRISIIVVLSIFSMWWLF